MSAETIKENKTAEFKIITDNETLSLKYPEVNEFVGGMVEAVTFQNGDQLLITSKRARLMG